LEASRLLADRGWGKAAVFPPQDGDPLDFSDTDPEEAYVDPAGSWAEAAAAGSDREPRWQILDRHRLRGHAALEFLAARGRGPTQLSSSSPPVSKAPPVEPVRFLEL
jgi:hypothetical protein